MAWTRVANKPLTPPPPWTAGLVDPVTFASRFTKRMVLDMGPDPYPLPLASTFARCSGKGRGRGQSRGVG